LRVLVRTVMKSVVEVLGRGFALQAGEYACEVRPSAWTKATAIAELMKRRPFHGRTPILVGDDRSDEDAFAFVNACQGISVRVGADSPTLAGHRFACVTDVTEWLSTIPPIAMPTTAGTGRGWDWTGL